ncbi:MAG: hypothetical protein V2B15_03200 [Bacteroidota bacterium]
MKKETEYFESIGSDRLMEINGGGFAYDVGRVIRFLGVSAFCATPLSTANGIADWIIMDAINDAANNQQ